MPVVLDPFDIPEDGPAIRTAVSQSRPPAIRKRVDEGELKEESPKLHGHTGQAVVLGAGPGLAALIGKHDLTNAGDRVCIRRSDRSGLRPPSGRESDGQALVATPVHITGIRDVGSGRREGCPVADPGFTLRA